MGIDKQKAGGCRKPPGHVQGSSMQNLSMSESYNIIEIESIPDGEYLDYLLSESISEMCLCTTPCSDCGCEGIGGQRD